MRWRVLKTERSFQSAQTCAMGAALVVEEHHAGRTRKRLCARPAPAPTTRHTLAPAHANKSPCIHAGAFFEDAQGHHTCKTVLVARAFDRHGTPAEVTQACAVASGLWRRAPLRCFTRLGCSRRCDPRATMRRRQAERSCHEREGPTKVARTATKTRFQKCACITHH